jgi:hypothetical protein
VPTIANRDICVVMVGTAQSRLCPRYGSASESRGRFIGAIAGRLGY